MLDFVRVGGIAFVAVAVAIGCFWLNTLLRPKHRVIWSRIVEPRDGTRSSGATAATTSFLIENTGRCVAEDIEILLTGPVTSVVMAPSRPHLVDRDGGARRVLIAQLEPGEKFGVRLIAASGGDAGIAEISWRHGIAEEDQMRRPSARWISGASV